LSVRITLDKLADIAVLLPSGDHTYVLQEVHAYSEEWENVVVPKTRPHVNLTLEALRRVSELNGGAAAGINSLEWLSPPA
jgi:hypothetical protein